MPICHKAQPSIVGNHTTADIDYHTSEAAKVKRTREQAYFNSYDFDAIEVLPYDDDDDDEDAEKGGKAKGTTKSSSQKHMKSKSKSYSQQQPTRQHLSQQPAKYQHKQHQQHQPQSQSQRHHAQPQQQQQKQQHPLSLAVKTNKSLSSPLSSTSATTPHHSPCTDDGSNPSNTNNNDTFMVDNRHDSSNLDDSITTGSSNKKYHSYLQRFGVAIFGGNNSSSNNLSNNKKVSQPQHQSLSSSSSSTLTATSSANSTTSCLAIHDDNKHLKVIPSYSHTTSRPALALTCTSSSSSSASVSSSVLVNADSLDSHRHSSDANNQVNDTVTSVGATITGATASSTAAVDGNFLLPRVMLKYQSTPIANNSNNNTSSNQLATSSNTSMSLVAATNNGATSAATTATAPNTGSSAVASSKVSPDVFPASSSAIMLHTPPPTTGNSHAVKKHSTASSSLSSLASDEIVEIHHVDTGKVIVSNDHKVSKVLPKLGRGKQPGRAASHQSQYSTDKSASSGYYSSNVCSTYSLEEHIYSEPTIDVKEKPLGHHNHKESVSAIGDIEAASSPALSNNTKPVEETCNNNHATLAIGKTSTAISVMRTLDYNRRYRYTDPNVSVNEKPETLPPHRASKEFNENLRILESSIENLDRHLKTFPGLTSQDAIVSYVQNNPYSHSNNEKTRSYAHLPTIKEAFDVASKRGWPEDPLTDDSLMDIDLDSFLLDGRKKNSKTPQGGAANTRKGIDNPTFLIGEQEENHYKCAKYINSCPEDAYRVESDILAPTRSSISEQSVALSVDLYPKRYEDQLHFQNTRELLEDVRDKIRLLTRTQESQDIKLTKAAAAEEYIPKELNSMISTLKRELELYLERMNQHSELEIRQLCTGLVNNQNIVKMKNAFERRRSLTDSTEHLASYEAVQGEMRALSSGVPISIRQQITTIKCSSDPNFKMKRKSLTEVFPISECYIKTTVAPETKLPQPPALPPLGGSQLHRNLNFHQPQLQQFNKENLEPAKEASASGTASGGETSETNDKDSILDWHRKKPSIWEMYYGTNRIQQSLLGASNSNKKSGLMVPSTPSPMCYPSSRPESDFTLDLPRAEQLRIKMEKEKKFRQRCRVITSFLSLIFFLLTVMVVSLVLTRGKRMFGSMI